MLTDLLQRWLPDPVSRRLEDSIRSGTGLSKADWTLDGPTIEVARMVGLVGEVQEWCQERIASIRRPYGIDQLAFVVACAPPEGRAGHDDLRCVSSDRLLQRGLYERSPRRVPQEHPARCVERRA